MPDTIPDWAQAPSQDVPDWAAESQSEAPDWADQGKGSDIPATTKALADTSLPAVGGMLPRGVQEGILDVAKSIPGMVTQFPKGAYQVAKFLTGSPQQQTQVAAEALKEAIPFGVQTAKDVQAPLGTRESTRGLITLGTMAAPGLELFREIRGGIKPPIQRGGEQYATQEGKIQEGILGERPRDDALGVPAETGVSGGVQPAAPVEEPVPTGEPVAPTAQEPTYAPGAGVGDVTEQIWYHSGTGEGTPVYLTRSKQWADDWAKLQGTGAPTKAFKVKGKIKQLKPGERDELVWNSPYSEAFRKQLIEQGYVGISDPLSNPNAQLAIIDPSAITEITEPAAVQPPAASEMTPEQFTSAAARGKMQMATGKYTTAEQAAREARPFESGMLAGYSLDDIAHFYKNFRGLTPEQAYKYFISDAKEYEAKVQPPAEVPFSITSIKNAQVDRERATRGLPPVVEPLRKSFGQTWDNATARIDQNPNYPDELLTELRAKPRPLTDEEDATLLHRQVDLQNQHAKAVQGIMSGAETGDAAAIIENKTRMAQLNDQLLDLYNIGKASGTESGRGLAARKMMAAEDFSLANMITEKRANLGGRPLTPEETSEVTRQQKAISARQIALDAYETSPQREAYRKRLKALIEDYRKRTAAGEFAKRPKIPMLLDKDLIRLKAELEQVKTDFWQGMTKDRMAKRSPLEKVQDTFTKWRRAFLLSGPNVLAKLTSAAGERMAFTPMEEVAGGVLGKIPGVSKVMKVAPREGGLSTKAEARAITEGFTQGMRDSWDTLKTGRSAIDLAYGPRNILPKEAVDFMGQIHGALKAPVKRNEFARTFEKLVEKGIANGIDVTDPLVQTRYGVQAYKAANRSIFLQDNRVVDFYKRGLSALDQPSKVTGKVPVGAKAGSTAMRVLFPIVKVPTNIVAETMQYSTGLFTGSARLANALRKGVETLPEEHADLIARELKKGSVGGAVMLLGYLNADKVGGYYQRGQKRGKEDVGFGRIKVFGHDIPPYLIHNPLLEQLQIGATIRRVAESKLRKRDTGPQGIPMGVMAAGLGVTEEVPFVRETLGELPKLFSPTERQRFLGEFSKSIVVPQAVQWAAAHMDKRGDEYVKRQTDTILQNIESGIPGLRTQLPEKFIGGRIRMEKEP